MVVGSQTLEKRACDLSEFKVLPCADLALYQLVPTLKMNLSQFSIRVAVALFHCAFLITAALLVFVVQVTAERTDCGTTDSPPDRIATGNCGNARTRCRTDCTTGQGLLLGA